MRTPLASARSWGPPSTASTKTSRVCVFGAGEECTPGSMETTRACFVYVWQREGVRADTFIVGNGPMIKPESRCLDTSSATSLTRKGLNGPKKDAENRTRGTTKSTAHADDGLLRVRTQAPEDYLRAGLAMLSRLALELRCTHTNALLSNLTFCRDPRHGGRAQQAAWMGPVCARRRCERRVHRSLPHTRAGEFCTGTSAQLVRVVPSP